MANSCNCAYAQIALLIGGETLGEYVERFGITEDMSFDGIYAVKGNFEPETDNQVALAWSAIGQHTDLINPCAWMTFMGAIGGGGSAAEPYLMERITLAGETTYQAKTQMGEPVMSETLAATLAEYMRNNVTQIYGAGNFPGLTVCAKSGTSELGGGKVPNAMFSGFVADDNYPLAFIVVVENGGYGAHTCVPILSAVLAECKAVMDGN
jgi:peptidoglycan glycosyltransferase